MNAFEQMKMRSAVLSLLYFDYVQVTIAGTLFGVGTFVKHCNYGQNN